MMYPAAEEMAELIAGPGRQRVLDVAAGHGLFGAMVAARNPDAEVVALDSEPVLGVAQETAQRLGVADRWSALPGDAFTTDPGSGYDLVLVTNLFHHFDPSECEKLMRRFHAALAPGGRCVTLEFIPTEDRLSPEVPASFSIVMLATTAAGDAYTFSEYAAMFERAGFAGSEHVTLARSPESLVVSRKS